MNQQALSVFVIRQNLEKCIDGFSPEAGDIFEHFDFEAQVERLAMDSLLYQVTEKFAGIDLPPDAVDNHRMGLIFVEDDEILGREGSCGRSTTRRPAGAAC